jgi:hypothetical protein
MSEEAKKELAREKGVEGVIAKKYPQLYERLRTLSEQTGQSVIDLLASYTNWALEIREFSTLVTPEDLHEITPKALYSALKLLLFFEERYIRLASYVNVSQGLAVFDALRQLLLSTQVAQQQSTQQPLLPLVPPQPSTVDRLINSIVKAIEMFSMGREEVRRELARSIAEELIRMSQQPTQQQQTQK